MYKALIIGAGKIAGGYDTPDSDAILSHAHAYIDNPEIELLGFYDVNFEQAQKMAKKWGVNAYKELVDADIISICTPDEYHLKTVLEVQKLNPKLIFLEKPICRNLDEIDKLKKIKTPILVNYSRSFSRDLRKLQKRIKEGEFGELKSGYGLYGKGFIHNGSHMTNLINFLLGKIVSCKAISELADFYPDDPSKNVILTLENGKQIELNYLDCRDYTIFELDLMFSDARIRLINTVYLVEIYKAKESEKFKDYKMLELSENIYIDMKFALKNAVLNIVDILNNKAEPLCSLKDGIDAIKFQIEETK